MNRVEKLKKRLIELDHAHCRISKPLSVMNDKRTTRLPLIERL